MHSSFQISESEHQHQHLFLNPPQFAPPGFHHHYDVGGAAAPSSSFLPLNFKLGLNEICRVENDSLHGIPHFWHDSAIKLQPLRKSLAAKASADTATQEMEQKEALKHCLEGKSRALYGELEEVYKNFTIAESDQTRPRHITPSEASAGEETTVKRNGQRKRRKKKRNKDNISVAQFFEHLVSEMMQHQEDLQMRFSERIERMDEERREREEAWRSQELARFEVEAEARAREKDLAAGREAAIYSYLEKITGQKFSRPSAFSPSETTSVDASNDFHGGWK